MTDQPILLFDSGVGGLTIFDAVRARLPQAPLVYCADSAGFPYGVRCEADLDARVPALLGRLTERFHPCLIVIACNTASVIALPAIRAALDLPVVGTVPAVKPAAALTRSGVIGVLGTQATVRQAYVDRLADDHAKGMTVLRHGSPELVEMAEAKLRGEPVVVADARAALEPLFAREHGDRLDTVVLACTHFPLLRAELDAAVPKPIRWVDSADGIARRVCSLLEGREPSGTGDGHVAVFTRLGERERALTPALALRGLDRIERL